MTTMNLDILVVEPQQDVRDLLRHTLERAGHSVEAASLGAEAVDTIKRRDFDVILSDVMATDRDGSDMSKTVREHSPRSVVVVTSTDANLELAVEHLNAGVFALLRKPFKVLELLAVLERAAENRRLRATAVLQQAGRAIFESGGGNRLAEVVAEASMEALEADDVSLMLRDARGRLYVAYSCGLASDITSGTRLALGERVAGRVARDRSPALIPDGLGADPRFAGITSHGRVKSSIVFPLASGKHLHGVLNLNRVSRLQPFRKADLEIASLLVSQAVLMLDNIRLAQKLVASERLAAIGQFAAGIAHDMRSPLNYMVMSLGYLAEEMAAGKKAGGGERSTIDVRGAISAMQEGIDRLKELVRDIGTLTRRHGADRRRFDLNEAIRSAIRITSAELRNRAILETGLGEGVEITGIPGHICQVFVNLLGNAAQAAVESRQRQCRIEVTTKREGEWVVAAVSDQGPGISPEHIDQVFEPFFTTKPKGEGIGLGLSICREIAEEHGGSIRVDSAPGRGATFSVRFPISEGSDGEESQEPKGGNPTPRILSPSA